MKKTILVLCIMLSLCSLLGTSTARAGGAISKAIEIHQDENHLIRAAKIGDIIEVQRLLSLGVSPFSVQRGWTPLLCAVQSGHQEVVELLLNYNVNVNAQFTKHWRGWTVQRSALHEAVLSNHTEIVKILLKYGANVNSVATYYSAKSSDWILFTSTTVRRKRETPLDLAEEKGCRPEMLQALHAYGAKQNNSL